MFLIWSKLVTEKLCVQEHTAWNSGVMEPGVLGVRLAMLLQELTMGLEFTSSKSHTSANSSYFLSLKII